MTRKPKTNHLDRMRKHYDSAIKQTIARIRYSGSSVTRGVHIEGFEHLRRYVRSERDITDLKNITNDIIRTRPNTWNVWWAIYFTDVRDDWYHSGTHVIEKVCSGDFDKEFDVVLQKIVDDYREEYGYSAVKGYSWVATHGDIKPIQDMEADLVEQFVEAGVFDAVRGNRTSLEDKLERNMFGGGNATVEEVEAFRSQLAEK